jgi:hypothetical protein
VSIAARSTVNTDRMVLGDKPLAPRSRIKRSTSDGRSLSSGMAPIGAVSMCDFARLAYSSLVASLRPDAASVVVRQSNSHDASVRPESRTGAPASTRARAAASLSRVSARVLPYTQARSPSGVTNAPR